MRLTRAGATTARLEGAELIGGPVVSPIAEWVDAVFLAVLWSPLKPVAGQRRCRVDEKKYLESQLDEFASLVEDLPESEVPAGMDRTKLLGLIGAGGAALSLPALLAACGGSSKSSSSSGVGKYPETPKWKFVYVNHVTTNPFFVPTQYGISDADAIFKTSHQWTGSETSDVGQMVSAMNTAISSGADGIAVAIIDAKAFNGPTKKALDAGIPVVAYNADAPPGSGNERLAYLGQDLFVSGQKMGERIVELIPSGDVAGFIATPGSLNIQPRIDGAKQAIKDSGKLIDKGFLDFTIDQQPYLQGFYPQTQLFLYKISGGLMAPSDTNTGLLFVTKDNVKPYLTTKTRYEGSSSSQQYVKTT